MTGASIVDLRKNLADYLNRVQYGDERIYVTRNGKRIAAIISEEDLKYLEALEDWFDISEAKKVLEEESEEDFLTLEDVLAGEE